MTREIIIVTPEHVELRFELAGLGSRFLAMLVDMLIVAAVIVVIGLLMLAAGVNLLSLSTKAFSWAEALLLFLLFLIWEGYFLFFEASYNGQTPGKRMVGIRVIRDSGHPVDFRSALLRNMVRAVDYLPGTCAVGFLSIFFSPQYRRLGDYVGGTLVVKVPRDYAAMIGGEQPRAAEERRPTIESGAPDTLPALPPEALTQLSSVTLDDYRAIRHFLDRAHELNEGVAASLARKLAEPLAARLGIDPTAVGGPQAFLVALRTEWERRMIHD